MIYIVFNVLQITRHVYLSIVISAVVYNHWTGTVDWNGGMEWWNHKFSRNEVKRLRFDTLVSPNRTSYSYSLTNLKLKHTIG